MTSTTRLLRDWSFTQVGGGAGTQDGEWLSTSEFPTTVHVELLKLKRIPDPVRLAFSERIEPDLLVVHWTQRMGYSMLVLGCRYSANDDDLPFFYIRGRRSLVGFQIDFHRD